MLKCGRIYNRMYGLIIQLVLSTYVYAHVCVEHTIQPGDGCWSMALRCGIVQDKLQQLEDNTQPKY